LHYLGAKNEQKNPGVLVFLSDYDIYFFLYGGGAACH